MSALVKKYKTSKPVRELSIQLTNRLQQKDFYGQIVALHDFVKNHIRYIWDVNGVETLQPPTETLRLRAGDCDDKSILVATMLESIGHPTRFLAVGFAPESLSHVLVQTKFKNYWVSVECTEPVKLGWKPKNIKNYMVQHNRDGKK